MTIMKVSRLIDASRVCIIIDGALSKEAVIRLLAEMAVRGMASPEEIVNDLLAREAKMTTGIGQGVAIPHARREDISKPLAALGISKSGIDYDALDCEPVHIILVFVTPDSDPVIHIETLSAAVGLFSRPPTREALINATTPEEIVGIINAAEAEALRADESP